MICSTDPIRSAVHACTLYGVLSPIQRHDSWTLAFKQSHPAFEAISSNQPLYRQSVENVKWGKVSYLREQRRSIRDELWRELIRFGGMDYL